MACCRWRAVSVIIGGIMVHLTLGTVFTFGNLTPYMTSCLRNKTDRPDLTYGDSIWIYACALMGQGFAIFLGGFIGKKLGVRITTILGSWFMSAGICATYFTVQRSFVATIFTYGVINGLGVGVGYPMPMACAMKWMPERKGLAGGLVVAGFGGGAFIFNFIQTAFINPNNFSPDLEVNGEKFFTQPELLARVPWAFVLTGGIYAVMQLIGVILLQDPPAEHLESANSVEQPSNTALALEPMNEENGPRKEELSDKNEEGTANGTKQDIEIVQDSMLLPEKTPLEVLRTRAFYTLWFCFLLNGQGIVFLSSLYKDYGQTIIKDDVFLATTGAFASAFNFSGRMFWGSLADRFSFKTAMMVLCTAFTCLMITFNVCDLGRKPAFFIWVCLLFGTLSGNYSLFSLAAAKSWGQRYYAVHFGFIFTSQTITAPLGAIVSGQLKSYIGWFGMFGLIAGFSFLSLILISTFNVKDSRGKQI